MCRSNRVWESQLQKKKGTKREKRTNQSIGGERYCTSRDRCIGMAQTIAWYYNDSDRDKRKRCMVSAHRTKYCGDTSTWRRQISVPKKERTPTDRDLHT